MIDKPEAIAVTISQQMLKERGMLNWYRDFLQAMRQEEWTYWYRIGNRPKHDPMYVYFVIGGKVKLRATFVMFDDRKEMEFSDGRRMKGKSWVVMCGPAVRPRKGEEPPMKGFQGFRYVNILF